MGALPKAAAAQTANITIRIELGLSIGFNKFVLEIIRNYLK